MIEKEVKNEKENETTNEIKVFANSDSFTMLQIGNCLCSALGYSHQQKEELEKSIQQSIQKFSLNEIKNFDVTIIPFNTFIVFSTKYFELRLFDDKAILYLEEKKYPEHNWMQKFTLTSDEARDLLQYIFSHAKKVSVDI